MIIQVIELSSTDASVCRRFSRHWWLEDLNSLSKSTPIYSDLPTAVNAEPATLTCHNSVNDLRKYFLSMTVLCDVITVMTLSVIHSCIGIYISCNVF